MMTSTFLDFFLSLVYPFESLLDGVFSAFYVLTNSYGLSVILSSLAINVLILPFVYFADDLKNNYTKKMDKLHPKIAYMKSNYVGIERYHYIKSIYRIYKYSPFGGLKPIFGLLVQIPFFIAAFLYFKNTDILNNVSFLGIQNLAKPDSMLIGVNLLPLAMTLVSCMAIYVGRKKFSKPDIYRLVLLAIFFLALLYNEPASLLLYWTTSNAFSLFKQIIENSYINRSFKVFSILFIKNFSKKILLHPFSKKFSSDAFIQSGVFLSGVLFIYIAIPLAASDTSMYSMPFTQLAGVLLGFFVISCGAVIILRIFTPSFLLHFTTTFLSFGALVAIYYGFLFPYELEALQSLELPYFNDIPYFKSEKIENILLLFFLFTISLLVLNKAKKVFVFFIFFANIILLSNTLEKSFSSSGSEKKDDVFLLNEGKDIEKIRKAYTFSKKSNVIVILLDAFHGGMLANIIEKEPVLKKQLDGFTYFPNTLATGPYSWESISSVAGGPTYQIPLKSNVVVKERYRYPLAANGYLNAERIAKKYSYEFTVYNPAYTDCVDLLYTNCLDENDVIFDAGSYNKIQESMKLSKSENIKIIQFFIRFSFMSAVPKKLKETTAKAIRSKGEILEKDYRSNIIRVAGLKNISQNFSVDTLSNRGSFKFIHNNISHYKWMLNEDCEPTRDYTNRYNQYYKASYCSMKILTATFEKLKDSDIYDITKIIVVSDHGLSIEKTKYNVKFEAAHALLLVKDFHSRGELQESFQFMSNSDTYGIALSGVSQDKEIQLDPLKNPIQPRTLTFIGAITRPRYTFNVTEMYEVKDNIFDENNWKKIQ